MKPSTGATLPHVTLSQRMVDRLGASGTGASRAEVAQCLLALHGFRGDSVDALVGTDNNVAARLIYRWVQEVDRLGIPTDIQRSAAVDLVVDTTNPADAQAAFELIEPILNPLPTQIGTPSGELTPLAIAGVQRQHLRCFGERLIGGSSRLWNTRL
jgi:hypothetical protein